MKKGPRERVGAIIAAGGSSRRMGGLDKIFAPLAGRPLLWHVLAVFQGCGAVDQVVVVLGAGAVKRGLELVEEGRFSKVTAVCAGGQRRQDSVARGLEKLERCRWVVVHDGARPCVTAGLIETGLAEARETGAAIAAVPLKDTVKVVDARGRVEATPRRESLWAAQTPQVFRFDLLAGAHRRTAEDVTDDASMVEQSGRRVKVYPGRYDNIKVTTPEDLALAETTIRTRAYAAPAAAAAAAAKGAAAGAAPANDAADAAVAGTAVPAARLRAGIGYDVHPLVGGRRLVLGGVEIPFERGLDGHSDADVLVHAIIDALLGAAGLGDIGLHFPPSDPQYRGVSSIKLLRQVVALLRSHGWRVSNVDASIVAERPRLAPFIPGMRAAIGEALGVGPGEVGVKSTTSKGLGFLGNGDGIAAHAVVLVEAHAGPAESADGQAKARGRQAGRARRVRGAGTTLAPKEKR